MHTHIRIFTRTQPLPCKSGESSCRPAPSPSSNTERSDETRAGQLGQRPALHTHAYTTHTLVMRHMTSVSSGAESVQEKSKSATRQMSKSAPSSFSLSTSMNSPTVLAKNDCRHSFSRDKERMGASEFVDKMNAGSLKETKRTEGGACACARSTQQTIIDEETGGKQRNSRSFRRNGKGATRIGFMGEDEKERTEHAYRPRGKR